jgi:hypothetical protein
MTDIVVLVLSKAINTSVPNSATSRVGGSPGATSKVGVLPGAQTRMHKNTAESRGVSHSNAVVSVKERHCYKTGMLNEGMPGGVPHGDTYVNGMPHGNKSIQNNGVDID